MKTTLLLSALLISFNSLILAQCPAAGYTCIPDTAFEAELVAQGIDKDGMVDGRVLTADISGVTALDITNKGISDLTGIEGFTSLESLISRFNNLTTVNLDSNTELTHLDLLENSLTAIDVQLNTKLTYLDVGSLDKIGKRNQIGMIDVSKNLDLQYLGVSYNNLNDLDVHLNTALTVLGCAGNNLTTLDVSMNTALTRLTCGDGNSIANLNLNNNNSLESIKCNDMIGMTMLTLPPSAPLQTLYCHSFNDVGLLSGTLNLMNYTDLEYLWIYGNNFSGTLDLSANTKLINVDCSNNALTAINMPNDMNTLKRFVCYYNNLTSLSFTNNLVLETLQCNNNPNLSSLNLMNNSLLKILDCFNNPNLPSLNLTNCSILERLFCFNNTLMTSMLLPTNMTLKTIDAFETGLTSLDASGVTGLEYLRLNDSNSLTTLTLPNTTTLHTLYMYIHQVSNLDLSKNTGLINLDIAHGNLSTIDVSMLNNLEYFYCNESNLLTSLNVNNNNNPNLDTMWAQNNPMLTCIQVDNPVLAATYPNWEEDDPSYYKTDCTLGIDSYDLSSISIYPNPSKYKLYIDLQLEANYTLTNLFGQDVTKGAFAVGTNELDTQALASGLYLLKLETPEGSATKKIIKN